MTELLMVFSCVYMAFTNNEWPDLVTSSDNIQVALDGRIREINTDYVNNKRIITALYRYIGINALSDIRYAFRSGDDSKANIIFKYICKNRIHIYWMVLKRNKNRKYK